MELLLYTPWSHHHATWHGTVRRNPSRSPTRSIRDDAAMRSANPLVPTWRELETWRGRNVLAKPARQFSTLPERGPGCNSPGLLAPRKYCTILGTGTLHHQAGQCRVGAREELGHEAVRLLQPRTQG